MRKTAIVVLILLTVVCWQVYCQTGTTVKQPPVQAPPKLEFGKISIDQARKELAKVQGISNMSAYLEAYALALPLDTALLLYREFFPKIPAVQKEAAAKTAVSLALLAGRLDEAIFFLPSMSTARARILELRLYLAAGKLQEAQSLLKGIRDAQQSKKLTLTPQEEAEIKLLEAWLFYFEGFIEQSFSATKPLVTTENEKSIRNEAFLLLWYIANSDAFAQIKSAKSGFDGKSIAATIGKESPNSIEHGIISGALKIAPSAWILESTRLSGLALSSQSTVAAPSGQSAQQDKAGGAGSSANSSTSDSSVGFSRLQVGWFSVRENAVSFQATLVKKGFKAVVEEQKNKDGESRWAVIVDAEGDWSQMQARLKDAGFESYIVQ